MRSAISAAAIALYRRYDGEGDGLCRSADRNADVSDQDWRIVDDLRQRAFIVATGRGSERFRNELEADLARCMPDEHVRREFQQLVDGDRGTSGE